MREAVRASFWTPYLQIEFVSHSVSMLSNKMLVGLSYYIWKHPLPTHIPHLEMYIILYTQPPISKQFVFQLFPTISQARLLQAVIGQVSRGEKFGRIWTSRSNSIFFFFYYSLDKNFHKFLSTDECNTMNAFDERLKICVIPIIALYTCMF